MGSFCFRLPANYKNATIKLMNRNEPATKQDVEETVQKVVGDVVGSIVGDAVQLISEQFNNQNQKIGELGHKIGELGHKIGELDATTNRIENKLDATIDQVDNHEVQLKRLQHKAA
jgi:ubiquinone biosynthesis protein UbiJ